MTFWTNRKIFHKRLKKKTWTKSQHKLASFKEGQRPDRSDATVYDVCHFPYERRMTDNLLIMKENKYLNREYSFDSLTLALE